MAVEITRTPSSNGNQKIWTWSAWVKKATVGMGSGDYQMLFTANIGNGSRYTDVYFREDYFEVFGGVYSTSTTTVDISVSTNRKFRDPSGFYHLVVAVDTTQATAANRVKIYVNGVQETSLKNYTGGSVQYPGQNNNTFMNVTTAENRIGASGGSYPFKGLMSHVHFIDGTAYAASDFGESDSVSGIWKPKTAPSVTHGTNGFFLKFENSGNLDLDSSTNNHTFATSGTLIQTLDTPSNIFATLNPLQQNNTATTYSNGNTKGTGTSSTSNFSSTPATLAVSAGKWYAEYKPNLSSTDSSISGFVNLDTASFNVTDFYGGNNNASAGLYDSGGQILHSTGTNLGSVGALSNGDIVMLAMDLDNGFLYWGKNGTWFNSANPATSGGTGGLALSNLGSNGTYTFLNGNRKSMGTEWNFGNGKFGTTALASSNSDSAGLGLFEYSVPSGYYSLCTTNIKNYG